MFYVRLYFDFICNLMVCDMSYKYGTCGSHWALQYHVYISWQPHGITIISFKVRDSSSTQLGFAGSAEKMALGRVEHPSSEALPDA